MTEEETREFIGKINQQYQADLVLEGLLFQKDEKRDSKKIFLFTGTHIPKVPAEWIGQHFGTIESDGNVTLSIEGVQKVAGTARKTIELSRDDADEVFAGKDLGTTAGKTDGYYILKTKGEVLGIGRVEGDKLMNQTPKSRRTRQQYQTE